MLAKKFHWPTEDIAEARESLEEMARIVEPNVRLDVIKDAPDDFLSAVQEERQER